MISQAADGGDFVLARRISEKPHHAWLPKLSIGRKLCMSTKSTECEIKLSLISIILINRMVVSIMKYF